MRALHPNAIRFGLRMPFVDVFGKAEAEMFAYVLLLILQREDAPSLTTPVTEAMFDRFIEHMKTLPDSDPAVRLLANPFLTPSPRVLLDRGYVTCEGTGRATTWTFTDAAVQRMLDVMEPRGEIVAAEGGAA